LNTFIFDYRGYGKSEGRPSERGTHRDAEAAWHHLVATRKESPSRIIFFGRSLGAALAVHLAAKHPPRALIVESCFASARELAADLYPFLPTRWLLRFHYSPIDALPNIDVPVLVIHSPNDEIIPFHHGQKLFAAARQPKMFLEITGGHNDGFHVSGGRYRAGIERFLSELAGN